MVQHWQLGLCSSCLVYRTTTPFLGPFLYRELDDAARRVQLVDDVSGAARLPCPAYGGSSRPAYI